MEIEAKFVVPDRQVDAQLGRLRSLAGYGLTPAGVAPVSDRYFDTLDRRFLAAGYACRLRQEGDALLLTLKGLGGVEGAVHRRGESEVSLPAWNPDPWPGPKAPRAPWRWSWLRAHPSARCSACASAAAAPR